jgi:hypothetical protein
MPTDQQLHKALHTSADYDADAKVAFHRAAKTLLGRLAKRLDQSGGPSTESGYGPRDPIRSNKGGIAVSGEITLHYERLYIQVHQSILGPNAAVLYRSCEGLKDYTGGTNNFMSLEALIDTEQCARQIESRVQLLMNIRGED